MERRYDALVLTGPPGSEKSFLGRCLLRQAIVSYVELEPIPQERFGSGEQVRAQIRGFGAFVVRSCRDQPRAGDERR